MRVPDPPLLRRHPANPIVTAADVPFGASLVFNPGVVRWNERYLMAFRVDDGDAPGEVPHERTVIALASSDDGVSWQVRPSPWIAWHDDEVVRAYDPRLSVVDDELFVTFAVDTRHGIRGALARVTDLDGEHGWRLLDLTLPDNRNLTLFPERIKGRLARLERPFAVYGRGAPEAFDLWCAFSPDGTYWGDARLVLGSEQVPWANAKIGPGAPPLRTDAGWLVLFHAVDVDAARELPAWHRGWHKAYTMGALVLDTHEPWRVLGMCREPVLRPEADYELRGFRGHVVFPGAALQEPGGALRVYYGAADTCIALAEGDVDRVVARCLADGAPTRTVAE